MSYRRRRRNDLTLADKVRVIDLVDQHTSQTDVAKLYDVSQSQISRIVSKRDEILEEWELTEKPDRKRRRSTRDENSDKAGESNQTTATRKVTRPQRFRDKGVDTSLSEQHDSDSASANGWSLMYWKDGASPGHQGSLAEMDNSDNSMWSKHFGSLAGKRARGRPRASANMESRISNQLLDVLKSYDLCDVYCADEFALQYAAMPKAGTQDATSSKGDDGTSAENKENKNGVAQPVKHFTVFLACNVTGSDKRVPLIIEDSNSGCFHGANNETAAGCQRASAPHAWMTADIFREYLLALDHNMHQQRRYVLLLVDNVPPHVPEAGRTLEHVRVLYVRTYATPFFHGIFYSVRVHYRRQVLLKLATSSADSSGTKTKPKGDKQKGVLSQSVDVSFADAVKMLQLAWQSVSPQDIVPCFSKAGICAPYIHGLPEPKVEELPEIPEGFISPEQFEEFVNFDTDVECSGGADLVSTDCRILTDLHQQGYTDVGSEGGEDAVDTFHNAGMPNSAPVSNRSAASPLASVKQEQVSNAEAMGALGVLRSFLEQGNLGMHNLCALKAQIYEFIGQSKA